MNWFKNFAILEIITKLPLIFLICIVLFALIDNINLRLKYCNPKPSYTTEKIINTQDNPVQVPVYSKEYMIFNGEKNTYLIHPLAKYIITGRIVAINTNFWLHFMRNEFDDMAFLDYGLVWGDLDCSDLYKYIHFKSIKTLGQARQLSVITKRQDIPWNISYVDSHLSHTHIVAVNPNVMGALLKAKKNDTIKLSGYLVDLYTKDYEIIARTSLSRKDTNGTSRGNGACEIMYVKSVQLGNKVYE